jgi:hypothetical protein
LPDGRGDTSVCVGGFAPNFSSAAVFFGGRVLAALSGNSLAKAILGQKAVEAPLLWVGEWPG